MSDTRSAARRPQPRMRKNLVARTSGLALVKRRALPGWRCPNCHRSNSAPPSGSKWNPDSQISRGSPPATHSHPAGRHSATAELGRQAPKASGRAVAPQWKMLLAFRLVERLRCGRVASHSDSESATSAAGAYYYSVGGNPPRGPWRPTPQNIGMRV